MPVQFRVGLPILQVSVPVNVTRVSLKSGGGSVSMIVRMGVRRSLLNLVVISLHSRQSAARIALGREDQTYPGGPHLRPGATRNRRDHHPTSSITLPLERRQV